MGFSSPSLTRPTELLKAGKINGVRCFHLLPLLLPLLPILTSIPQGILLSVTNTFEGTSFVDQSRAATAQVADYISQLFPNFGIPDIDAAVAQYADLGTNIFQVEAIIPVNVSIFI